MSKGGRLFELKAQKINEERRLLRLQADIVETQQFIRRLDEEIMRLLAASHRGAWADALPPARRKFGLIIQSDRRAQFDMELYGELERHLVTLLEAEHAKRVS